MIAQLNKAYIKTRPSKAVSRLVSYFFFEGRPLTTKGRWINPLLFSGYRIITAFPQIKKIKSPVFIIGTGRSGSTLLGMLLSLHKDAAFLNEPKALWHFAFDKEDVIGSYSQNEAHYKLDERHLAQKSSRRIKKLYGFYLSVVFSNRVIDKYPELIFRIDYIKKIFPDAKFLFLQRSGFQTCASTAKWIEDNRIVNNNIEDWWGLNNRKWNLLVEQIVPDSKLLNPHLEEIKNLNHQLDMAAVEWVASMEEGIMFQQKHPGDILAVKYEDLTAHPEIILANIFSFCNLDNSERCIRYAKKILNTDSGNKTYPEIAPFLTEIMHKLMKALGY